jgi:hypothetical protein
MCADVRRRSCLSNVPPSNPPPHVGYFVSGRVALPTPRPPRAQMSKSALIRFRCDQGLSDAVDRIAAKQRRQRADPLRLWPDDFDSAEDRRAARKKN